MEQRAGVGVDVNVDRNAMRPADVWAVVSLASEYTYFWGSGERHGSWGASLGHVRLLL